MSELSPTDHRALIERYITYLASPSRTIEELAAFLHRDVRWREMPNSFAPVGRSAGWDGIVASWHRGREYIPEQHYQLHQVVTHGDEAAFHFAWEGRVAKPLGGLEPGTTLRGNVASFARFRDGRIVDQVDYPCYEPLPKRA